ncbi:hypothetical protein HELRODRAFT_163501 [Helobdella robusta]|uniref:CS domain-containing protein n=1 Tax=Helobdella robusta TaxID=6412 RepID=T1EU50_HELRO|nr:hypothetical protein HELRODRAFT_163501 [Helobdella robusta]ESN96440.1 hypothetical protein HELRODRAFT_163501 [Helobdella robusta]
MANDRHLPSVQWAQRKDKLYLTINVEDCKDPTIKLEQNSLHFEGVGNKEALHYDITIEFYGDVDPEKSKHVVLPRHIQFVVYKKESGPFWPRLLKDKTKVHWLKTDFDKWRDEDDSDVDESKDFAFEDMMNNMGSYKGPEEDMADDERDSDDEG